MIATAIFPLLILALIVVGLVVLARRFPRPAFVAGGVLAFLAVIGICLLSFLRTSAVPTMVQGSAVPLAQRPAAGAAPGLAVSEDVHASEAAALEALAVELVARTRAATNGTSPAGVVILYDGQELPLAGAMQALQRAWPDARIVAQQGPESTEREDGHIHVRLERALDDPPSVPWSSPAARQGRINAAMDWAPGQQWLSARWRDRPWVAEWATFSPSHRDRDWVRAESNVPAATPEEARALAVAHGTEQLAPRVGDRMMQLRPGTGHDHAAVADAVRARLERGELVADRFAQRVDRPYGTLFSEAMLIDASPAAVQRVAAELVEAGAVQAAHARATAASFAGLVVAIVLLYAFLSAVTKGYFRLHLVAASAALLAAGVTAMLLFVG